MTKYMHTLNGQPAEFYEPHGIVCFNSRRIKLVDSLAQIRREQKRSIENVPIERGAFRHGYVTVKV